MGVLRLLAPDQSTVLWDFDDSTGAANPNTVITNLGAALDLGSLDPALALEMREHGAALLGSPTLPTVQVDIPFMASASTDTNLWQGLGQLGRYLLSVSRDHPLFLEWTELASTLYMDIIGLVELPNLLRGQAAAGIVATRKSSLGPYTVRLLRQPWMRAATVTTSADTVENDPATGTPDGCRLTALTVTGDLPTPGRVRVNMSSGSAVQRVFIGHRAQKSRASTFFSDFISDTAFAQCEASGRGWTITLGTDTTATVEATGSPGSGTSVATVAAGTNLSVRRVRATRTTLLDSLRGSWRVWLRCQLATFAPRDYRVSLHWGLSATADATNANDEVRFYPGGGDVTTMTDIGFVELDLGRIDIPEDVSLGGLALEVWTRQADDPPAGGQDLDLDFLWLAPVDAATVVVGGATTTTTLGKDLTSPPDAITGDPAWSAGSASGNSMRLNTANEAVGWGPNTGTDFSDGLHRITYRYRRTSFTGSGEFRVTNVTDNTEAAAAAFSGTSGATDGLATFTLAFTAAASKFYQPQVTLTAYTTGSFDVEAITHEFVPSLASGESVRTDPGPRRYAADRLDASANLAGSLGVEGVVPVMLEPGANHVFVRCDDVPMQYFTEAENVLGRAPSVTVNYDPRYAL